MACDDGDNFLPIKYTNIHQGLFSLLLMSWKSNEVFLCAYFILIPYNNMKTVRFWHPQSG